MRTTTCPPDPATAPSARQRTRVTVCRVPGGHRVRVGLETTGPTDRPVVRPLLLHADGHGARVALVPDGALLLADDAISVSVEVGEGAALELVEPAGTVAYDMRGGAARWDVDCVLHPRARLAWHGQPFVVAAGAQVCRRTHVRLGEGARIALRETVALGRTGEPPGDLCQHLSIDRPGGAPLLAEDLHLHRGSIGGLLGGRRVMDSVLVLGMASPQPAGPERFVLDADGWVVRRLAEHTHEALDDGPWRDATAALDS